MYVSELLENPQKMKLVCYLQTLKMNGLGLRRLTLMTDGMKNEKEATA